MSTTSGRSLVERLSPLSYAFIAAEDADPSASLVIGSIAVIDGPAPSLRELRSHVAGRLDLAPRYRERLQRSLLDLRAPGWTPDRGFDLHRHVGLLRVAAPGGPRELAATIGEVMSLRMERDRALWDVWLVDGLADGRWAVVCRVHHALADGISGTALLQVLYDQEPAPDTAPVSPPAVGVRRSPWLSPRALATTMVRGSAALVATLRPVASTPLTGPIGPARSYAWSQVSLAVGKQVAHARGVSLNDVVLACVAAGFRDLLLTAGLQPDEHALRTLVPVSSHAATADAPPDNLVTLLLPDLPVEVDDPLERLAQVHARVTALRASREPEVGVLLQDLARAVPFAALSRAERWGLRLPQRQIATVATNVPGPRRPLTCLGRPVVDLLPYVPLADRVRVGVAVLSYGDTMAFGVTGDTAAGHDLDALAGAIAASWEELHALST